MQTTKNKKLSIGDKLKRNIFSIYRKSITKKHELNYLFWECTLRCNLNCRHCGSDCLKSSGIKDMPVEDFAKVLDSIKSKNTSPNLAVAITGGEPLVRDDLEKAGKDMKKAEGWDFTPVEMPGRRKASRGSRFLTGMARFFGKTLGRALNLIITPFSAFHLIRGGIILRVSKPL